MLLWVSRQRLPMQLLKFVEGYSENCAFQYGFKDEKFCCKDIPRKADIFLIGLVNN